MVYTTARTLAKSYQYTPLQIGLVTLSYGVGLSFVLTIYRTPLNYILLPGCVAGSVLGGRWSDYEFDKVTTANGGKSDPEVRLLVLHA